MINLEQIRLLESRITRALDLIRVLKEENSTLRRGLESAQKRMRELEGLVDGLKTDQKEIESIIVRTLHNLDDLEETAAAAGGPPGFAAARAGVSPAEGGTSGTGGGSRRADPRSAPSTRPAAADRGRGEESPVSAVPVVPASSAAPSKEELDIF